jgi:hypothetical protein
MSIDDTTTRERAVVAHCKTSVVAAALAVAAGLALHSVSAQQQGVKRTELQRYDLSVPGREVIQVRVDLDPGVTFPLATYIVEKGKPLVVLAQ